MPVIVPQIVYRGGAQLVRQKNDAARKLFQENIVRKSVSVKLAFVKISCAADFVFCVPQLGNFLVRLCFGLFQGFRNFFEVVVFENISNLLKGQIHAAQRLDCVESDNFSLRIISVTRVFVRFARRD